MIYVNTHKLQCYALAFAFYYGTHYPVIIIMILFAGYVLERSMICPFSIPLLPVACHITSFSVHWRETTTCKSSFSLSALSRKMTPDEAEVVVIGLRSPEILPTIGMSQSLSTHLPLICFSDLENNITLLSAFLAKRMWAFTSSSAASSHLGCVFLLWPGCLSNYHINPASTHLPAISTACKSEGLVAWRLNKPLIDSCAAAISLNHLNILKGISA